MRLDARVAAELFFELAHERVDGRFAGLDFSAGKFPFERHRLIGAPLRHEDAAGVVAAERGDDQFSRSGPGPVSCFFSPIFRAILP